MADYTAPLGSQYTLLLQVNQAAQNTAANQSTVSWSLTAIKNTGTGYWSNTATTYGVTINGFARSWTLPSYTFIGKRSILLASGSDPVDHNPDGTKSVAVSAYWNANNAPALAAGSVAKSLYLSPIARATAPSVTPSPATVGSTVTVSLPRASGAFTHNVTWTSGTLSGTIATGVATSTTWTVPDTLAEYPTRSLVPIVITAVTKNGAATVGSKSTTLLSRATPTYTSPGDLRFPFDLRARLVKFTGGQWVASRTIPASEIQLVDPHSATATCSFSVSRLAMPEIEDYGVVDIQVQNGTEWVDTGLRFAINRVEVDGVDASEMLKYSGTSFVDYMLQHAYTQKDYEWASTNPGVILSTLMADATGRGWGPRIAYDFSSAVTTLGDAWLNTTVARDVSKGTPISQVLDGLVEDGLLEYRTEYRANKAYLVLFNPGTGSDWASPGSSPIVNLSFAPLSSAPRRGTNETVFTRVTVAGDGELIRTRERAVDDANVFGQLEGWVAASGVKDNAEADRIGDFALSDATKPTDERTFEFSVNSADRHFWPYLAVRPGDWVIVPAIGTGQPTRMRVGQVTLSRNVDGDVSATILTGDRILSGTGALAKRQQASSGGAISGGSLKSPATLDASIPSAPNDVVVTSDGYWNTDGAAKSAITVAWSLVSTSAAGTSLAVDYYEIWWRPDIATPWAMQTVSGDGDVTLIGWDINKPTQFRVRGRSAAGIFGQWSLFTEHTTEEPDEPLLAPSVPVVTDNALGTISIAWDGLIGGTPAPKHLAYVRAEIADATLGVYSPAGAPLIGAGMATIDPGAYGSWLLRLVPVDRLGLVGTPSSVVATTTVDPGLILRTPKAPVGLAYTTASDFSSDGSTLLSWFDLSWTPVTEDVDSEPIGVSGYEVWGHPDTETDMRLMVSTEGSSVRAMVGPGSDWTIEIRAISDTGARGLFSTPLNAVADGTVDTLGTPSTPTVTTTRGLIRVDWDGLIDGAIPVPSFRYARIEYAPTETLVFQPAGVTFTRGGGSVFIPGDVGVDYTVRLIPVAGDGVDGTSSIYASVEVVGINEFDFTPLIQNMLTEPRIETSDNANEGVKLYNGGIVAYDDDGNPTIFINANDGTIYFAEAVINGSAIVTGSVIADKLDVVSLVSTLISSPLGNSLNLASNDSVNILVGGAVASVQSGVDAVADDLGEMQTYYQFGPDGASITSPSSVFSVQITNEQINMVASGAIVSYWNASGLVAPSLIANQTATIGAHQERKEGARTTTRPI